MLRLLVITGALVLVHNLYAGAMTAQRAAVRWTCAALAVIWGYDLNFYTIAYLVRGMPAELVALRALAALIGIALLGVGVMREQASGRFSLAHGGVPVALAAGHRRLHAGHGRRGAVDRLAGRQRHDAHPARLRLCQLGAGSRTAAFGAAAWLAQRDAVQAFLPAPL
jgi:hypothetical protein